MFAPPSTRIFVPHFLCAVLRVLFPSCCNSFISHFCTPRADLYTRPAVFEPNILHAEVPTHPIFVAQGVCMLHACCIHFDFKSQLCKLANVFSSRFGPTRFAQRISMYVAVNTLEHCELLLVLLPSPSTMYIWQTRLVSFARLLLSFHMPRLILRSWESPCLLE